ncbi:hypothetical protein M409DRAFT_19323 [Zasmidium cellare ATCC 36951]|uniref:Uncharacterized protein n=1 Tax=Zasmidium cellare ATCC 36951 TaxID=1080233 RepID=A0A6A6CUV9_ZASCE|nr:uncharacterized protein M409DRAFT_19323 [Zasmidium cellare ATCC 36951]KAF2170503.1 hypothetical protein M409DRAFT_19323 [Zasmidium cellare ATCC 36951]
MDYSEDSEAEYTTNRRMSARARRRARGLLRDRKRPVWEPPVHRSGDWIEENPMSESGAMDCLLRQGCQCPPKHYASTHECLIPGRRLQCLREIQRWQNYRHVVEAIATKLPKELVLEIFEYLAADTQPHLHLQHKRSLAGAARSMIGESSVLTQLQPLAEEAILNASTISVNVAFQGDQRGKVAVLDEFVSTLRHPIRHFELPVHIEIAFERQQYPAAFYGAAAGMGSLLSQLPRLQTLYLTLRIALSQHPRDPHRVGATTDFLNIRCRKGFSGTTTFKQAIVDLLDAARTGERCPAVSLELRYEHPDKWRAPWRPELETYRVQAGVRPAQDVVEEADANHQW